MAGGSSSPPSVVALLFRNGRSRRGRDKSTCYGTIGLKLRGIKGFCSEGSCEDLLEGKAGMICLEVVAVAKQSSIIEGHIPHFSWYVPNLPGSINANMGAC